ncbi:hypothetical protein [Streptomyces sp. NPDC012510]|uniref:hypothetical protein n=1 Tax=Streptomyces sp. NPDC012510 TaxID=3364838 RepID=UPI0036E64A9C
MLRRWAPLVACSLAPLVLLTSGQASAATTFACLSDTGAVQAADKRTHPFHIHSSWVTKAVPRQQARKTWEDWVWRGPIERCSWSAAQNCTYNKSISKTTSYEWSIGLTLGGDAKKEPFTRMASLVGGFGRSSSTSITYTSGTWYKPGQFAQPISVVERRWRSGDFVGAMVRTPTDYCSGKVRSYTYDPNKRWGYWADNIKVRDYGTFHIYW